MSSIPAYRLPDLGKLFTDPSPQPNYPLLSEKAFSDLPLEEQFWLLEKLRLKHELLTKEYQSNCGKEHGGKGGRPSKWSKDEIQYFANWADKMRQTPEYQSNRRANDTGIEAYRMVVREMLGIQEVKEEMQKWGYWTRPGEARQRQIQTMAKSIKQRVDALKKTGT